MKHGKVLKKQRPATHLLANLTIRTLKCRQFLSYRSSFQEL